MIYSSYLDYITSYTQCLTELEEAVEVVAKAIADGTAFAYPHPVLIDEPDFDEQTPAHLLAVPALITDDDFLAESKYVLPEHEALPFIDEPDFVESYADFTDGVEIDTLHPTLADPNLWADFLVDIVQPLTGHGKLADEDVEITGCIDESEQVRSFYPDAVADAWIMIEEEWEERMTYGTPTAHWGKWMGMRTILARSGFLAGFFFMAVQSHPHPGPGTSSSIAAAYWEMVDTMTGSDILDARNGGIPDSDPEKEPEPTETI